MLMVFSGQPATPPALSCALMAAAHAELAGWDVTQKQPTSTIMLDDGPCQPFGFPGGGAERLALLDTASIMWVAPAGDWNISWPNDVDTRSVVPSDSCSRRWWCPAMPRLVRMALA